MQLADDFYGGKAKERRGACDERVQGAKRKGRTRVWRHLPKHRTRVERRIAKARNGDRGACSLNGDEKRWNGEWLEARDDRGKRREKRRHRRILIETSVRLIKNHCRLRSLGEIALELTFGDWRVRSSLYRQMRLHPFRR